MASLRNRQKQDRRRAIVEAAQKLFAKSGYGATTVEDIAAAAGVSHVTVHNYYGTKAGVLLAMVAQSDAQLLERLSATLPAQADPLTLAVAFARQIMLHADQGLGRATWRQVLAAVAAEAGSAAAAEYAALDGALVEELAQRLGTGPAAAALFDLINARFQRFVTSDQGVDAACDALHRDLSALLSLT